MPRRNQNKPPPPRCAVNSAAEGVHEVVVAPARIDVLSDVAVKSGFGISTFRNSIRSIIEPIRSDAR